jgi:hypothetical protein
MLSLSIAVVDLAPEFSLATGNRFDPLEQNAARARARGVIQAAATAWGKTIVCLNSTQQHLQQQQQQRLDAATQQGIKHWLQASTAAVEGLGLGF